MTGPPLASPPPPPHYSPDGQWFWNTVQWVPAQYVRQPTAAAVPTPFPLGPVLMLLGGIGLVVGAFLPWVTIFGGALSRSGVDGGGDGWFFVGGGVLIMLLAAVGLRGPAHMWGAVVTLFLGLALAGILAYDWHDLQSRIGLSNTSGRAGYVSYGGGLYALAVATGLTLLGGLFESFRAR